MRGAVRDMERAHRSADVTAMTAANRRFHFTVFDAAAMPRMADMIRVLWDGTDRYRSLYFATAAHRNRVRTEHAAIMSAVSSGDADAAVSSAPVPPPGFGPACFGAVVFLCVLIDLPAGDGVVRGETSHQPVRNREARVTGPHVA
jgi:hypothetical protein